MREQHEAFNRATVGRVVPVLFEAPGRGAGQLTGRSPWMQAVHATAPKGLVGGIAPVRVTRALANSLAGELVIGSRAAEAAAERIPA